MTADPSRRTLLRLLAGGGAAAVMLAPQPAEANDEDTIDGGTP